MRYQGNGFAPLAGGLTLRKESLCAEWWLKELWKLPLVVPSPLSLDKKVFEGFFFVCFIWLVIGLNHGRFLSLNGAPCTSCCGKLPCKYVNGLGVVSSVKTGRGGLDRANPGFVFKCDS